MITGDNILTAIAIGRKLKFHTSQHVLTLEVTEDEEFYFWDESTETKINLTP